MRIAYGIFGYGRGHATRAMAVLPELCRRHQVMSRRHQVMILAGGDAYDALSADHPVTRIATLPAPAASPARAATPRVG